jgi:hypothetical protein
MENAESLKKLTIHIFVQLTPICETPLTFDASAYLLACSSDKRNT